MAISYSRVLLQHTGKVRGHRASRVRGHRASQVSAPLHICPEATVMGGPVGQAAPSAPSWWSHPKRRSRWLCTTTAASAGGKGLRAAVPGAGGDTGALAPSTAPRAPAITARLSSAPPLRRTRRHLDAAGRKKNAVIYFPARIGLTSLLVFAAGTDLGAGEGLHVQTLTCDCVSPLPSTGCSGLSGRP